MNKQPYPRGTRQVESPRNHGKRNVSGVATRQKVTGTGKEAWEKVVAFERIRKGAKRTWGEGKGPGRDVVKGGPHAVTPIVKIKNREAKRRGDS